jgi:hypothetical protein
MRVLRLLEKFSREQLISAVEYALNSDVIDPDSLRTIVEHRSDQPAPLFPLDGRPHLAPVRVEQTDISFRPASPGLFTSWPLGVPSPPPGPHGAAGECAQTPPGGRSPATRPPESDPKKRPPGLSHRLIHRIDQRSLRCGPDAPLVLLGEFFPQPLPRRPEPLGKAARERPFGLSTGRRSRWRPFRPNMSPFENIGILTCRVSTCPERRRARSREIPPAPDVSASCGDGPRMADH